MSDEKTIAPTCKVCGKPMEEGSKLVRCLECSTGHHEDCWEYVGHCSTFGCGSKNAKPSSLETILDTSQAVKVDKDVMLAYPNSSIHNIAFPEKKDGPLSNIDRMFGGLLYYIKIKDPWFEGERNVLADFFQEFENCVANGDDNICELLNRYKVLHNCYHPRLGDKFPALSPNDIDQAKIDWLYNRKKRLLTEYDEKLRTNNQTAYQAAKRADKESLDKAIIGFDDACQNLGLSLDNSKKTEWFELYNLSRYKAIIVEFNKKKPFIDYHKFLRKQGQDLTPLIEAVEESAKEICEQFGIEFDCELHSFVINYYTRIVCEEYKDFCFDIYEESAAKGRISHHDAHSSLGDLKRLLDKAGVTWDQERVDAIKDLAKNNYQDHRIQS